VGGGGWVGGEWGCCCCFVRFGAPWLILTRTADAILRKRLEEQQRAHDVELRAVMDTRHGEVGFMHTLDSWLHTSEEYC
jgi:hypothetical protein